MCDFFLQWASLVTCYVTWCDFPIFTLLFLIQDLILNLARKVEKMETALMKAVTLLESLSNSGLPAAKQEAQSPEHIVSQHAS